MHVGICRVWLNEKSCCFCFYSLLTTKPNACCITVFSVWVDGWPALGKQVDIVPAEGFTVGWGERGNGSTVWRGWSDKHNSRLKHAGVSSATRFIVFYSNVVEQQQVPLALTLWQLAQPYPKLWLMSPELKSCKVKQVSPVPTSGCVASFDVYLSSFFSLLSYYTHSVKEKHTRSVF